MVMISSMPVAVAIARKVGGRSRKVRAVRATREKREEERQKPFLLFGEKETRNPRGLQLHLYCIVCLCLIVLLLSMSMVTVS